MGYTDAEHLNFLLVGYSRARAAIHRLIYHIAVDPWMPVELNSWNMDIRWIHGFDIVGCEGNSSDHNSWCDALIQTFIKLYAVFGTPKIRTETKKRMALLSKFSTANNDKVGWSPEVIKTAPAIADTNIAREYTAADWTRTSTMCRNLFFEWVSCFEREL